MSRQHFILAAAVLMFSGMLLVSGCNRPFDPINPMPEKNVAATPTP